MINNKLKRHIVRILPLGDSLTQGDGNPSAYRYHLFRLLSEAKISFRFVGGVKSGDWRLPPDCRYHSGRGGITSEGLLAYHTEGSESYIPSWADAAREAEVVLLCIGANDAYRCLPVETYTTRIDSLLDMLYSYNPNISSVYIATMRTRSGSNEKMKTMNDALLDPAFADAHNAKGRDVHIVDFNGEGTPENLITDYPLDDGHPNDVGNRKLAEIWYSAIADRIRELSEVLSPADANDAPSATCESKTLSISVGSGERIKLSPACGGEVSYLFESDDETVVEVDDDGTVYGVSEGMCKVRVMLAYGRTPVDSVNVSVSGVSQDKLDFYPLRHTPPISDEGYTAPETALRPTVGGVCVRYPHWTEGEIVTRAAYPQDRVCVSFDMTAVSAFPVGISGSLTLSLGDISLTFRNICTHMTLSVGDRSVEINDSTPSYRRTPIRLVREGGTVTLTRGGITLLSLEGASSAPGDKAPLRITWKDYHAMIHYFYDLTVATRD